MILAMTDHSFAQTAAAEPHVANIPPSPLSLWQRTAKRCLDVVGSVAGLLVTSPFLLVAVLLARWDTRASGFFRQERTGLDGKPFQCIKLRTMRDVKGTTVTTANDPRITPLGHWLRKLKLDELPQLWNVLRGDMSFVGPRPDVAEYTDLISGADRVVLSIRPGITGPASIKFRDEAVLLAAQDDPEHYNKTVIYPEKTRINRHYIENYSLAGDIVYILRTIIG